MANEQEMLPLFSMKQGKLQFLVSTRRALLSCYCGQLHTWLNFKLEIALRTGRLSVGRCDGPAEREGKLGKDLHSGERQYNLVFKQEDLLRVICLLELGDHGWLGAAEVVLSHTPLRLVP